MATPESVDDFMKFVETRTPDELNVICQRGLKMGGKFALLARVIMGDTEAADELRQLIDDGRIGPGFDNSEAA